MMKKDDLDIPETLNKEMKSKIDNTITYQWTRTLWPLSLAE
jgi:hypothetical protein